MADFFEFGVPILVFVGYYLIAATVLRSHGLRLLGNWGTAVTSDKVAAWRKLRRWQYVVIQGLLLLAVPMLLLLMSQRYLGHEFNPAHVRSHPFGSAAILVIFIAGGLVAGFYSWKKIWDDKYDLPTQSER